MTYPEVVNLVSIQIRREWNDRYWLLALQTKDPLESYQKYERDVEAAANDDSPHIDDLPVEQQAWLRAT